MSDLRSVDRAPITAVAPAEPPTEPSSRSPRRRPRIRAGRRLAPWILPTPLLAVPLYFDESWLLIGILAMAAAVGAIGLTVLTGTAGQLSLAHAFFLAVGAYGYAFLAGDPSGSTVTGLGLPSAVAAALAVLLAGLTGLMFGPVAARLNGLYLGVASLALVFVGSHILTNARPLTGGYNGRDVTPLSVLGFELSGGNPSFSVLGVPYGGAERLWYVALAALVVSAVAANRVVRGRPGRALQLMRDNAAAAGSMGIPVRRYKLAAFAFSSLFAGAGGVLTALAFGFIVPQYFDLHLSVLYLAMVIIGGLGSVGGAIAGAVLVGSLPLVLERYSEAAGLLAEPGSGGLDPTTLSRFIFGAAVVLVIIAEPGGLAALGRRVRSAIHRSIRSGS